MAKLTRYTQQVFGSTAGTAQMAEFGSLAAGTPLTYSGTTITPAIVQALSQYLSGWLSAVIGSNSPAIEDMNALCYLFAYQLAYGFEMGIAEWDSATTYYIGSMVNSAGTIYASLINANLNNAVTNGTDWGAPILPGCVTPTSPAGTQSCQANATTSWPNLTIPTAVTLTVPSTAYLLSAGTIIVQGTGALVATGTGVIRAF